MTAQNPGSSEALEAGCTCPVFDNHFGAGAYGQERLFFVNHCCPVHGIKRNQTISCKLPEHR